MTGSEPTPAAPDTPAPYLSLYRRFRPQRFSEVLGQEFVSLALRNAVREGHVGHAYLFSGPRGTGKTSSARILAKALNCAVPEDGEPCGICASCTEIAAGSSFDVHELDAASNNGVDAMRDLVAHAALGTPGRWKVYIVDEVHMLSQAASNALLKTLEEPPGHVVFVLATTDPQKVLPTIRSRTQHFEFRLIGPDTLHALLERVRTEAGLDLPEHAVEMAVSKGRGSARDALSVLDQVVSAGIVEPDTSYLRNLAEALATRDATEALVALASAVAAGRDPLLVAGELADHLRQGFLAMVAPDLVTLDGDERSEVADIASKMGLPALVRAVEALGSVQVDMRESPDPRLHVEVCLLRLTRAEVDDSLPGLLERVERLERAQLQPSPGPGAPSASTVSVGEPVAAVSPDPPHRQAPQASKPATPAGPAGPAEAAASAVPEDSDDSGRATGPAVARRSLGAIRREAAARAASGKEPAAAPGKDPSPTKPVTVPPPAITGSFPTRDELVQVWGDGLLASLPQRARARFRVGRFLHVDDGVVVFALPNEMHRSYCEEVIGPVESALSERFGVAVKLRLITDPDEEGAAPRGSRSGPGRADAGSRASSSAAYEAPQAEPEPEDEPDLLDPAVLEAETEPAGDALSPEERLKLTFPGAEEV